MTGKKRILFLVDDFSKGGTARVVETIIKGLDKEYIPILACLDASGKLGADLQQRSVTVFCLDRKPGWDYALIFRLARIMKDQKIALLHTHQYTAYFYGSLAAILAGFVPIIFTEHGRHFPDVRKPLQVLTNKILLPLTAAVTAVSEAVKVSLINYEGIPAKRIEILINGIDPQPYEKTFDTLKLRQELSVEPSCFLLGMVARLGEEKDHGTLLRAMVLISRKIPAVRLLIIGDGPKKDELKKICLEIGIEHLVIFTGNRSDIPCLLAALDLSILSSFYEGTSITLLEAMFSGKATVVSRVGGNPYIVQDGVTGLLFNPGDEHDLAQKIMLLLENEPTRKRMGEEGRKLAYRLYTQSRMVREYERLYKSIIDKK
ncbi:MAG: glycosyltransferase [Candidatus Schekmanbacteria bacterium]|nr:glycosyltransferase [Candidatus Schekmanbacteria bacterium]